MPRRKAKKSSTKSAAKGAPAIPPLDQMRTGMPALDSIIDVKELRKGKKRYQLLVTNEVDEYEKIPAKAGRKKR